MTCQHDDFRAASRQFAGLVPAVLGWTPDQFWNATPAELKAIFKAMADPMLTNEDPPPLSRRQLQQLTESLDHG